MEWHQAIITFAVAFIVTYCTVPLSKKIAVYLGAIDYPGNRRINTEAIPRCGGIALYFGLIAAALTVFLGMKFFGWEFDDLYTLANVDYVLLFIGVTMMFGVGLVDDISQIPPVAKFVLQVVAASIVVLAGISIGTIRQPITGTYVSLGWLDFPVTVLWLVAFVNIINLIDGLDGLAAGIVAIVSASLFYLVIMRGSFTLSVASLSLIAVCLAFLRYNFHPASTFMGDSGSHLLGLVLGIISVGGILRTQSIVIMLVPVVIAGVPIVDTISAIIRRTRGHERIDSADLGHVHHRLLDAGFGQRKSVAILWACSAVLAFAGCMIGSFSGAIRWTFLIVLAIVVFAVIWRFKLFRPVLRHHYDNRGKRGRRKPRAEE